MAVTSLRFQSNFRLPSETQLGFILWDGNPVDYPHWRFRTNGKFLALRHYKEEDFAAKFSETMICVVENLKGDALTVVMVIGLEKLLSSKIIEVGEEKIPEGYHHMMEAMKKKVYPQIEEEAKLMYAEFHTIGSSFSRQPTESMISYEDRRGRCYELLRELDSNRAQLSD